MANAIVSTVSPKASATPTKPIPTVGKPAAKMAAPQPPKTSQNVPNISATERLNKDIKDTCLSQVIFQRLRGPGSRRKCREPKASGPAQGQAEQVRGATECYHGLRHHGINLFPTPIFSFGYSAGSQFEPRRNTRLD